MSLDDLQQKVKQDGGVLAHLKKQGKIAHRRDELVAKRTRETRERADQRTLDEKQLDDLKLQIKAHYQRGGHKSDPYVRGLENWARELAPKVEESKRLRTIAEDPAVKQQLDYHGPTIEQLDSDLAEELEIEREVLLATGDVAGYESRYGEILLQQDSRLADKQESAQQTALEADVQAAEANKAVLDVEKQRRDLQRDE